MNIPAVNIICDEMTDILQNNILRKWYPLAIDTEYGGYFTNISHDFRLMTRQEKMIVTQARHIWTTSKAAAFFGDGEFENYSRHGFDFLKEKMWDETFGGFYQIRSRDGSLSKREGWYDEKRTYGNAFAVFGLAALYNLTKEKKYLELAVKAFEWIENHSFDNHLNGYFQFLTREGNIFDKWSGHKTKAPDAAEAGLKDQNSSIHLLEAYTELYNIWENEKLRGQLRNLLILIRDTIASPRGYLRLFFDYDWKPVSFRNSPREEREKNYGLDHVSFGHDYETSFLMLEASHSLGIENDFFTLSTAKRMMDHAIKNGWDDSVGGFFDEGYYFEEFGKCEIIRDSKTWWAQAEALNALLLFSKIYPKEKIYSNYFLTEWEFIKKYLIDYENGDWYWGSIDKQPFYTIEPKGSIWKETYHAARALMNCILILSDDDFELYRSNEKFRVLKARSDEFIRHWRSTE